MNSGFTTILFFILFYLYISSQQCILDIIRIKLIFIALVDCRFSDLPKIEEKSKKIVNSLQEATKLVTEMFQKASLSDRIAQSQLIEFIDLMAVDGNDLPGANESNQEITVNKETPVIPQKRPTPNVSPIQGKKMSRLSGLRILRYYGISC